MLVYIRVWVGARFRASLRDEEGRHTWWVLVAGEDLAKGPARAWAGGARAKSSLAERKGHARARARGGV